MTKVASYDGRQTRPRSVTVTIWGSFLLAFANGWRAFGLSQQGNLLLTLDASLNPWLGLGLALIWSLLFIAATVALWQRRAWTRFIMPILLLTHGIYQLVLLTLFARSTGSRNGWLAIGLLFTVAVLFAIWALYRPSVRWYFKNESLEKL